VWWVKKIVKDSKNKMIRQKEKGKNQKLVEGESFALFPDRWRGVASGEKRGGNDNAEGGGLSVASFWP